MKVHEQSKNLLLPLLIVIPLWSCACEKPIEEAADSPQPHFNPRPPLQLPPDSSEEEHQE